MISAAEATAFLDYFCDGAARTDHAVMIDAPWGAGKTHFIKAYLQSRHAAARTNTDCIGAPFLYASLYGVSSVAEVREQFYTQAHPFLSSKAVKLLGSALAGVAKKLTGAEFDKDDTRLDVLLPRLDARVLVFDDLERVAMPVVDALGLINGFVEHGDFKVIVIANQSEIPPKQRSDYERQREKLIGRTLTIRADPTVVLDKLITEMRCEAAREAGMASREAVTLVFESSETHNLRSLRAAIADFDRLVGALDAKLASSPEALRRLLTFIVATEMEFRTGLTRPELEALVSARSYLFALSPSASPEIKKAEALRAKYPDVEWQDSVVPPKILADYLVTGVLDVAAANEAILIHPLIAEPGATPAWRRLIEWPFRGLEAFRQDRSDVLDALNRREVVEPGEILQIVGIALWLESMDSSLLANVEHEMLGYVDAVEAARTLLPNRAVFTGAFNDAWGGIIFPCLEDPRFVRVRSHLEAAVSRGFSETMKAAAPDLLARLRREGDDGVALYDGRRDENNYGGVAILQYLNPNDFADLLVIDGRINRSLSVALVRRYQYWGTECALLLERPWLGTLQQELLARAATLGPPFGTLLQNAHEKMFSEISVALELLAERCEEGAQAS
jgi:hypothetical protein